MVLEVADGGRGRGSNVKQCCGGPVEHREVGCGYIRNGKLRDGRWRLGDTPCHIARGAEKRAGFECAGDRAGVQCTIESNSDTTRRRDNHGVHLQ